MNPKRLAIAIVAVFAGAFATDFFIHGVWMKNTYAETMNLWRPEAEMRKYFSFLLLSQFVYALAFVMLWAKGFARLNCLRCACLFGLFMGLFKQVNTIVSYAVQPFPPTLVAKWFIAGLIQGVLMGLIVFFVYKPKPEPAAAPV